MHRSEDNSFQLMAGIKNLHPIALPTGKQNPSSFIIFIYMTHTVSLILKTLVQYQGRSDLWNW